MLIDLSLSGSLILARRECSRCDWTSWRSVERVCGRTQGLDATIFASFSLAMMRRIRVVCHSAALSRCHFLLYELGWVRSC